MLIGSCQSSIYYLILIYKEYLIFIISKECSRLFSINKKYFICLAVDPSSTRNSPAYLASTRNTSVDPHHHSNMSFITSTEARASDLWLRDISVLTHIITIWSSQHCRPPTTMTTTMPSGNCTTRESRRSCRLHQDSSTSKWPSAWLRRDHPSAVWRF